MLRVLVQRQARVLGDAEERRAHCSSNGWERCGPTLVAPLRWTSIKRTAADTFI